MKASDFFKSGESGNYRKFVWGQLENMNVDDLKIVDIGEKSATAFRMNLSHFTANTGRKFKTKLLGGNLYVGRVE